MNPTEPPSDRPCDPRFAERCPCCGATPLRVVWTHGHGQCGRCGQNIDPCCGGAPVDLDPPRRD